MKLSGSECELSASATLPLLRDTIVGCTGKPGWQAFERPVFRAQAVKRLFQLFGLRLEGSIFCERAIEHHLLLGDDSLCLGKLSAHRKIRFYALNKLGSA